MRLVICLNLLIWFSACPALCEEIDLNGAFIDYADLGPMQDAARDAGSDIDVKQTVMELVSGQKGLDTDLFIGIWQEIKSDLISRTCGIFAAFAVPMILSSVVGKTVGRSGKALDMLCASACAASFLHVAAGCAEDADSLIRSIAEITDAAFPAVTGLMAISGTGASAALLTPLAALAGKLTVDIMDGTGIRLCAIAVALASCGAFGGSLRLDGMFSLVRYVVMWGSGIMLAFFVGVLSVQGLLGGGYDSAAFRTAKFAFDKMVPVIGRGLSDSLGSVLSSVSLVRSAIGITGMLTVVTSCFLPVARLWTAYFAVRLAAAAAQPLCGSGLSAMAGHFAQAIAMLMTVCLVSVTMSVILLGAAITAGRGVYGGG